MSFVDRVNVNVRAGKGGDGLLSFRHEKFIAKGGPDGGDGGDGGSVVMRASRNQNTLAAFRYKKLLKASDGQAGGKRKRHGKNGGDLIVDVPVGTVLTDEQGNVLADLTVDGQTEVVAQGGKGGFGNAHFTSSTRQAPRVAEKGETGTEFDGILELKMIADVGIIGLPNAGKSTLLSVISNAKPEIADYPFTTIQPNLGVVDIDKKHSLLMADIPGLIEGASQGKGLGDEFLRHTERTNVLLHLIDAYSDNIAKDYRTIIRELKEYRVDLSGLPQIVALTKIEGFDKKKLAAEQRELEKLVPKGTPVVAFSSLSREGVDDMLRVLQKQVAAAKRREAKAQAKPKLPVIGIREADNWQVQESKDGYVVTGPQLERFAHRTRFGEEAAEERLRDILARRGVIRQLERQGIQPGQDIVIGQPPIGSIEY
jgi:GTP-binding protein